MGGAIPDGQHFQGHDRFRGRSDRSNRSRYLADVHRIVRTTDWAELEASAFARQAATVFAYLNQAHPFREGNGRASKIFMDHVAELSGFTFDFSQVSPSIWNNASMMSGPDRGAYEPVPDSLFLVFQHIAVEGGWAKRCWSCFNEACIFFALFFSIPSQLNPRIIKGFTCV